MLLLAAGLLMVGAFQVAAAADPQTVVRERIAHFKSIGRAAKGVQDEVRKSSPDAKLIRDDARTIEVLAGQVTTWFPNGSGPQPGVRTQARTEIWSKRAEFRRAADALAARARALEAATATTNDRRVLTQDFMALAQACKSCHQQFRNGD